MAQLFENPANGRRYALMSPQQDLLGDWCVPTWHGASQSRRGGFKVYYAKSQDEANRLCVSITKTRLRRGYQEMSRAT